MKYQFTIKVPVYDFSCKVIMADEVEKLINKLNLQLGEEEIDYQVEGFTSTGTTPATYHIFFSINYLNVNTISHEVSHLIDFAFGDRIIEPTGEHRAYLTGYLTEQIVKYAYKKNLLKDKWLNNGKNQTEYIH